jgi:hypothetical protein
MYKLRQLTHKHNFLKTQCLILIILILASWTSCLFSTLNTIKEIPKESLKQWTYNTHTIASKLKKKREMLLTTLEHNQHDVIDVI